MNMNPDTQNMNPEPITRNSTNKLWTPRPWSEAICTTPKWWQKR